eukprot:1157259-Pelagomonas_calceolata.AAC.7
MAVACTQGGSAEQVRHSAQRLPGTSEINGVLTFSSEAAHSVGRVPDPGSPIGPRMTRSRSEGTAG